MKYPAANPVLSLGTDKDILTASIVPATPAHDKANLWSTTTLSVVTSPSHRIADALTPIMSRDDMNAAESVVLSRAQPLRDFDQISMQAGDLVRQAKIIAPYLAGKAVVFVGDNDGASAILGALAELRSVPRLERMMVLDFDERVLGAIRKVATKYGFEGVLETRLYNVFDAVPKELSGQFDWFYTNPPYGSHNGGESARLFVARGMECCRPSAGRGCIILPDDPDDDERAWTRTGMLRTQQFLVNHRWSVDEKVNHLHRYHLDDDAELASCLLLVRDGNGDIEEGCPLVPYAGRVIDQKEIVLFYGRKVAPPYPRYVRADGTYDTNWPQEESVRDH